MPVLRVKGRGSIAGKDKIEGGPFAFLRFDPDPATVVLDDALDRGEFDSRAGNSRSEWSR
jgi:hypothetical protein